jgi:hypothetical protein
MKRNTPMTKDEPTIVMSARDFYQMLLCFSEDERGPAIRRLVTDAATRARREALQEAAKLAADLYRTGYIDTGEHLYKDNVSTKLTELAEKI